MDAFKFQIKRVPDTEDTCYMCPEVLTDFSIQYVQKKYRFLLFRGQSCASSVANDATGIQVGIFYKATFDRATRLVRLLFLMSDTWYIIHVNCFEQSNRKIGKSWWAVWLMVHKNGY